MIALGGGGGGGRGGEIKRDNWLLKNQPRVLEPGWGGGRHGKLGIDSSVPFSIKCHPSILDLIE